MPNASLQAKLWNKFRSTENLPRLRESAVRLSRLIDQGDPDSKEMEAVIASDPAFAVEVVRLAMSPYYGLPQRGASVKTAVLRLGQHALRAAAISFTMHDLAGRALASSSVSVRHYSDHASAMAYTLGFLALRAQKIGKYALPHHPDEMFTAGLLHELPLLVLAVVDPALVQRAGVVARRKGVDHWDALESALGVSMAPLGSALALSWNLPEILPAVWRNLKKPEDSEYGQELHKMVGLAEHLSLRAGIQSTTWESEAPIPDGADALVEQEIDALTKVLHLSVERSRSLGRAA